MNHIQRLNTTITGVLLAGGIALGGFGLTSATAHAGPVSDATFANPQPGSPGSRVGFDPQPDPPGVRVGFDPQPEPPVR